MSIYSLIKDIVSFDKKKWALKLVLSQITYNAQFKIFNEV